MPTPTWHRSPYDVGGSPQPLDESLGTSDPTEAAYRKAWLTRQLQSRNMPLEDMRAPNNNFSWSPSATVPGEAMPEWDRASWQEHVLDSIESQADYIRHYGKLKIKGPK